LFIAIGIGPLHCVTLSKISSSYGMNCFHAWIVTITYVDSQQGPAIDK